jgi:hypothetical protein
VSFKKKKTSGLLIEALNQAKEWMNPKSAQDLRILQAKTYKKM